DEEALKQLAEWVS
nr:Chain B, Charged multivesicular body protein 4a peptide [synthetic construct]